MQVTEEEILAMTEEDVKELMEDVRLECLRLAATLGFFFLSTGGTWLVLTKHIDGFPHFPSFVGNMFANNIDFLCGRGTVGI